MTTATAVIAPAPGTPLDEGKLQYDPVFGARPEDAPAVIAPRQPAPRRRSWDALASYVNADADRLTAAEMLERGGLDWTVRLDKTYRYKVGDGGKNARRLVKADELAVVREDTEDQLGTVGSRYKAFQNHEVFQFGDNIVGEGKGKWVATGLQGLGAKVFMVMELDDPFDVLGDLHKMFIVFRTSFTGLSALRADLSPIRMSCFNQNTLITKTALASWSITHTTNHDLQVHDAHDAFAFAQRYEDSYCALAADLAAVEINAERALNLITVSMIKRAQVGKVVEDAFKNWATSTTITDAQRMTGWGLLNGVTEYFDHIIRRDNPNAAFEAAMAGEAARVRNALAKNLLRLAA
jgi:phage/plasmid-like protein (TIGR03299 family)